MAEIRKSMTSDGTVATRQRVTLSPTNETPALSPAKPLRLDSVDMLRGLVMVIMALDHVRDYFTNVRFDPTDLTQTTAALFLTRWVTHFCAPVFVFLAGTGAFLSASRGKPIKDLSRFLWTRGLMLVVFEITIVRFGWLFNFSTNLLFVQVIWAIGVSMICLAGFVHFSKRTIATIGIVMIAGHNAFDGIRPESLGSFGWVWQILHVSQEIPLSADTVFLPFYPLIPWIGVMAAGYAFGSIMLYDSEKRRKTLLRLGFGMTVLFILVRAVNIYGDLLPWSAQKDALFTFFSFINTTKYPPSLDYLLMTLGPSIILLGLVDRSIGSAGRFFVVYGRVPMFYYVVHIYFIHALVVLVGAAQGYGFTPFLDGFFGFPETFGFGLSTVYLVWIGVVLALYPACRWYAELKHRRKYAFLSYL